jgi:HD-GYP domain-containing protein (c-di-GMP phosphodiesterase class II)
VTRACSCARPRAYTRSESSAGSDIPLGSRIVAAACEYDLLLREHGDAGRRHALIALIEQAGGRLDPMVVDALARVVERAAARIAGS